MIPGSRRLRRPVARHTLPAVPAPARRGPRVGLLGGSFNPAHEGHRRISVEALKRLGLDQVWWLVAPQNPLKEQSETAPLSDRLKKARKVAHHPRIWVSDLEARFGTRYTAATLARLRSVFPEHRFVWLMGADNMASLHRWHRWRAVASAMPIAVFDREPYSYAALVAPAAKVLATTRWSPDDLRGLVEALPPAWCLLRLRTHPAASSAIRAAGEWRPQR